MFSQHPEQDKKYGIYNVCDIVPDTNFEVERGTFGWFLAATQTKLLGEIDLLMKYRRKNLIDNISKDDICLSIGGDNYCYAGTDILAAINTNIKKRERKQFFEDAVLNQNY